MPIRKDLRIHYTVAAGWPEVRAAIRARAELRCECIGECGAYHAHERCNAPHLAWIARPLVNPAAWVLSAAGAVVGRAKVIRVVIQVAHLDHDPANNDHGNLRALCQRCHLLLDRGQHRASQVHATWSAHRHVQRDLVLDVLVPLNSGVSDETCS